MRWMPLLIFGLSLLAAPAACLAAPAAPPAGQTAAPAPSAAPSIDEALNLISAYQAGYFQVVAVSCFQLYSSTGIIQTDMLNGVIGPSTALTALQHNSLLQSVCLTTLTDIRGLTPAVDKEGLAELDRLTNIITAEGELLRALQDYCQAPGDTALAAVGTAQQQVEAALTAYAGDNPVGLHLAPSAEG
jgi:hypothetical protein